MCSPLLHRRRCRSWENITSIYTRNKEDCFFDTFMSECTCSLFKNEIKILWIIGAERRMQNINIITQLWLCDNVNDLCWSCNFRQICLRTQPFLVWAIQLKKKKQNFKQVVARNATSEGTKLSLWYVASLSLTPFQWIVDVIRNVIEVRTYISRMIFIYKYTVFSEYYTYIYYVHVHHFNVYLYEQ